MSFIITDPFLSRFVFLIGEVAVFLICIIVLTGFVLLILSGYAMRTGTFIFPGFLKAGILFLEGFMRALFRLFGVPDNDVLHLIVRVQNILNKKSFLETPVSRRAVFIPHCLRAVACPAHLHPEEGLKCRSCGLCTIGYAKKMLEQTGYMVFIVPGSSFIKRLVKEHRPKAIVGIGCLMEVKEGNSTAERYGLISMCVVTTKDGCVETTVNWDQVFEVTLLGVDPSTVPVELRKFLPYK